MASDAFRDLELLVRSRHSLIAVDTYEEERLEEGVREMATRLGIPFFVWTITEGLRRHGASSAIYDSQPPAKALANVAAMDADGVYLFKDLHRHFDQPDIVRKLRDLAPRFAQGRRSILLSGPRVEIPAELVKLSVRLPLGLPTEDDFRVLVRRVLRDLSQRHRIRVDLTQEELDRLVERLRGFTLFEAERALTKAVLDDLALTRSDLDRIVEMKKSLLEAEGIVEYAIREWGLPFLRFEPARMYEKFVGESEKNLERALGIAERMAPCVLMVDEIEKGFAYTASGDADAGLSRRIFGRLLGWLQDRPAPVFVIATCNQITQLPPELMRKGRFDEIFFIDLPGREERKEIFAIHLRRRKRDPATFDLDALAGASDGFSGAEIEQAIVSALHAAFSDSTDLETRHLLEELRSTRPLSVTRREEVDALRAWADGRTVKAS